MTVDLRAGRAPVPWRRYDTVLATAFGPPGLRSGAGRGDRSGSAFSQARKLPASRSCSALFELDAAVTDADLGIGLRWKGLEVTAIDGTAMELARNDVLEDGFGNPGGRRPAAAAGRPRMSALRAFVDRRRDRRVTTTARRWQISWRNSFRPAPNLADRGFLSMHRWIRFSAAGADPGLADQERRERFCSRPSATC